MADMVGIAASSLGDISPSPPFVAFACAACVFVGAPMSTPPAQTIVQESNMNILPVRHIIKHSKATPFFLCLM
jgi:hypothetical protein